MPSSSQFNEIKVRENIIQEKYKEELLAKERNAILKQVRAEFRDRTKELEANILAYQDLLIMKDDEMTHLKQQIVELEQTPATEGIVCDVDSILRQKIQELNIKLQQAHHPNSFFKCEKHYNETNRNGPCEKGQITYHVYKRIEDLN